MKESRTIWASLTEKSDQSPFTCKLKVYWKTTKGWTASDISDYHNSIPSSAAHAFMSGRKFTSEDFSLELLCQFASTRGLPIKINDGVREYRNMDIYVAADHEDYESTPRGFIDMVMRTFGAGDIQNASNTTQLHSVDELRPGDVLAQANDAEGRLLGRAHHIQVVTRYLPNEIEIMQGNSVGIRNPFVKVWHRITLHDVGAPRDASYAGTLPQRGRYVKTASGWDYLKKDSGGISANSLGTFNLYRWNFNNFNA